MSEWRDRSLRNIGAGDIVFAKADDGWGMVLLVHKATKTKIFARHIPSQTRVELGRDGKSTLVDGKYTCEIVSTRPLPPDAYAVACGLDRKVRFGQPPDGWMLTDSEIQFLLRSEAYFMARPLADADLPFKLPEPGATPASFDLEPPWRE
jgi:hypothetical protein